MMISLLSWTLFILGLIVLVFPIYLVGFAIAGLCYRNPRFPVVRSFRKMAVIIPAYREDEIILDTARHALSQDYPADRFDVIVVADGLRMDTIKKLVNLPVRVIPVEFRQSTKVKSLRKAVEMLAGEGYVSVTILDADNLMQPDSFSARMLRWNQATAWSRDCGHQRMPSVLSRVLMASPKGSIPTFSVVVIRYLAFHRHLPARE